MALKLKVFFVMSNSHAYLGSMISSRLRDLATSSRPLFCFAIMNYERVKKVSARFVMWDNS